MSLIVCPWPMDKLLPHSPPMLLLDEAVAYSPTEIVAEVTIRPDHPLARPEGVAAHVGIELMAQACGAHVGALAQEIGAPVRVGFLLGTRNYRAEVDWFRFGDRLRILARSIFMEDGMGVYDCRIERDGVGLAEAQLTLFQPDDVGAVLAKIRGDDA